MPFFVQKKNAIQNCQVKKSYNFITNACIVCINYITSLHALLDFYDVFKTSRHRMGQLLHLL